MPKRPPAFRPKGHLAPPEAARAYDRERRSHLLTRRLYATASWRANRAAQLQAEPLCKYCLEAGRITAATICDHVEPHRGDPAKFWAGPFQSLCKACHDGRKQAEEARGGGGSKV